MFGNSFIFFIYRDNLSYSIELRLFSDWFLKERYGSFEYDPNEHIDDIVPEIGGLPIGFTHYEAESILSMSGDVILIESPSGCEINIMVNIMLVDNLFTANIRLLILHCLNFYQWISIDQFVEGFCILLQHVAGLLASLAM